MNRLSNLLIATCLVFIAVSLILFHAPRNHINQKSEIDTIRDDRYGVVHISIGNEIGTGFLIGENKILTNSHVVHGANKINVTTYQHNVYKANIIYDDENSDLALIELVDWQVYKKENVVNIIKLETNYDVLDTVYTMGHPYDFPFVISKGVVANKIQQTNDMQDFKIQVDAKLYQGNSGGPLLNSDGSAIGVDDSLYIMKGGSYGFAIPVAIVNRFLADQPRYHETRRTRIGVQMSAKGYVVGFEEGSGAKRAGVMVGDLVYATESGKIFETNPERGLYISTLPSYENVNLKIKRNDKVLDFSIVPTYAKPETKITPHS